MMYASMNRWIGLSMTILMGWAFVACTQSTPPVEVKPSPTLIQTSAEKPVAAVGTPAPNYPTPGPNDPTFEKLNANLEIMNAEDIANYSKGLHCVFKYWQGTVFDWKEEVPGQYNILINMNPNNLKRPDLVLKAVPKAKVDLLKKGNPIVFSGMVNEVQNSESYGYIFGVTDVVIH